VFVVHGSGFVPLTQVRVQLVGHGAAAFRPTVDQKGTFNYAIDQGHVFFAGPIPAGLYHVLVTGAQGRRATAAFRVLAAAPPPPGSPPPTGDPSPASTSRPSSSAGARLTRATSVQGA
jgi:hypothetical protein